MTYFLTIFRNKCSLAKRRPLMCDWRCWFENGSAPPQMLSLWDTITFVHPDLISEKSKLWPLFSSYSFYSNWIQSIALFSLLWHLCWKRKKNMFTCLYPDFLKLWPIGCFTFCFGQIISPMTCCLRLCTLHNQRCNGLEKGILSDPASEYMAF